MAALSAARNTPVMGEASFKTSQPVKASTKIYQGGLVMTDSTGYAVPGASGATTNISWGIALSTVDNTGGSNGALSVDVMCEAAFLLDASGLTQANNGSYAYFTDDHTITTTATSNSKVGTIIQVVSATQAWVYIGVAR